MPRAGASPRAVARLRRLSLLPAWAVVALLFLIPLGVIGAHSLLTRGAHWGLGLPCTLESYVRLLDPLYAVILLRSVVMAAATALCLLLAFPAALFISRAGRRKRLYLHLVIVPFWTSFLVRTYAWMFLLRDSGLFNTMLPALGLIREPLPLLYNDGAVLLGPYAAGFYAFLHLPLLILAVFSFNSSRFTVWEGFSWRWYDAAFQDAQLTEAALNSLIIAVAATAVSTMAGTLAACGLWKRGAPVLSGSLYLTLVRPEIVTGVALLAWFQFVFRYAGLQLGLHTVIAAHVSFSVAYVVVVVLAPLRQAWLKNLANLDRRFQAPECDPRLRWSAPYMWGATGIAYNRELAPAPAAWADLWSERLRGRLTMLDDPAEVRDQLVAGDVLAAQLWATTAQRAIDASPALGFVYPAEGFPLYADNAAADALLPEALRAHPTLYPPPEVLSRGEWFQPLPAPAQRLRHRLWTEIKAA